MTRQGNSHPQPSDAPTALDELAAIFWRAAVAKLEQEIEQDEAAGHGQEEASCGT